MRYVEKSKIIALLNLFQTAMYAVPLSSVRNMFRMTVCMAVVETTPLKSWQIFRIIKLQYLFLNSFPNSGFLEDYYNGGCRQFLYEWTFVIEFYDYDNLNFKF